MKMKKWILSILITLVMVQLASAIQDCTGLMNPSDMPCHIISSWQFPNACNTYTITIFNQTPTPIRNATMGDYGGSGRCNITFGINVNETKTGSYLLNWTSGDSSKIVVEADEMSYITIGIILAVVTFIFAYLATHVKNKFYQITLSLMTLMMIFSDFFISVKIIEIIDSSQLGMISNLTTLYSIFVIFFRFAIAAAGVYILYYMYKYVLTSPLRKREEREKEEFYDR